MIDGLRYDLRYDTSYGTFTIRYDLKYNYELRLQYLIDLDFTPNLPKHKNNTQIQ